MSKRDEEIPGDHVAYLRGLVGARLANKDNWLFLIGGSKGFLNFLLSRPMPVFKGMLLVSPHPLVAGDVVGHPELWVMIVAQLKATDPVEARRERKEMAEAMRLLGEYKGRIRPDQDIFLVLEPKAPEWAGRLLANYLEFLCTGEGEMEPQL